MPPARRRPASSITTRDGEKHVQPASVVICCLMGGAEPAPAAQFGDRQAPQRPRQCERARRQIHHDAFHRRRRTRCSTTTWRTDKGTIGGQFMSYERYSRPPTRARSARRCWSRRRRQAAQRPDRHAERPARPVRRRAAAFMKRAVKGFTRFNAGLRGAAEDREPRRTRHPEGRVRHAARPHRPQLRRQRSGAVERQSRGRHEDRPRHRRQGGVAGAHRDARHPPDGRHHHGHRCRRIPWSTASARPTRCRTSTSPAPASSRPAAPRTRPTPIFALSLRGAEHLAKTWSTVAG